MNRIRLTIAAAGAIAASSLSGTASAATLTGTVVHRNPGAQSFVVASSAGALRAVHSTRKLRLGTSVSLSAHQLTNGTFTATTITVGKRHHRARLRGVVTYANRKRGVFTLSSRGASILLRASGHAGGAHAAAAVVPATGDQVVVDASIDDHGQLGVEDVHPDGQVADGHAIELEGVVQAVDQTARTITLSADDDDQANATLLVHVPDGVDLTQIDIGMDLELRAVAQPDGSYLLQRGQSDDNQCEDGGHGHGGNHDDGDQGSGASSNDDGRDD